ncbi:MAG: radical SAM protein, partial [Proteobacteria bacterium]|nr:radical SAM protein [Pseudomonadota bacterium]
MPASDPAFGVYVHWPFCESKCPYCDFNSHVRDRVAEDRWRAAYRTAITAAAMAFGPRRVETVFFGGGTPSRMHPDTVAAVLDAIGVAFDFAPDAEITLEANPASAEVAKFRNLCSAGVNRLSLGMQSL